MSWSKIVCVTLLWFAVGASLVAVEPEPGSTKGKTRQLLIVSPGYWRAGDAKKYSFDVFDLEGRFLGAVDAPEGFQYLTDPFIRDDMVLALVQSDEGVQYVKRYRLVTPADTDD